MWAIRQTITPETRRLLRLLAWLGLLPVTVALSLTSAGRVGWLPWWLQRGAETWFSDARHYHEQAVELAALPWGSWWATSADTHVRLFSLAYAGPWFPHPLLTLPVTVGASLGIVTAVYLLARRLAGPRVAWWAALGVGLWPSLILHASAPLLDPLFSAGELLVSLGLLELALLGRAWVILAAGLGGFWLTYDLRWMMGEPHRLVWSLGLLVASGRAIPSRPALRPLLAGCLVLGAMTATTSAEGWASAIRVGLGLSSPGLLHQAAPQPATWGPEAAPPQPEATVRASIQPTSAWGRLLVAMRLLPAPVPGPPVPLPPPESRLDFQLRHLGQIRRDFARGTWYSGSRIDPEVAIWTWEDLVVYLPRAVQIGLFAPFPAMWVSEGREVGRFGRLLAGAETLAMYGVLSLAAIGLWRARRRAELWPLVLLGLVGVTLLGLAIPNVGALYRMRYAFWVLTALPAVLVWRDRVCASVVSLGRC